jgi:hypothetical protein
MLAERSLGEFLHIEVGEKADPKFVVRDEWLDENRQPNTVSCHIQSEEMRWFAPGYDCSNALVDGSAAEDVAD